MKPSLHKMAKALLLTAFSSSLLMSVAHANNPAPTIKADAPNRYVVKKGDTLWDISGRYLDSPWRWKEIWATNTQIKNPNLIYPNDILILCVIQGKTLAARQTTADIFQHQWPVQYQQYCPLFAAAAHAALDDCDAGSVVAKRRRWPSMLAAHYQKR